jgi:hypothetical protein
VPKIESIEQNSMSPAALAALPDASLLDAIQRQCFRYFWDGADAISGLAADRRQLSRPDAEFPVTVGGSGFGMMALIVAVERGWVTREAALERVKRMLDFLTSATSYHGVYSHFMNTLTGLTVPLFPKDDGGDLVESSFLCMGLLCLRQYFSAATHTEQTLRQRITTLWERTDWQWYARDGRNVLYWHWSPKYGWELDHEIRGWNECLITYVLAAASPQHGIEASVYQRGYAAGRHFRNGESYYGIKLPLGVPFGGPLFFAHYSFCGLDPRGLTDRYADYWQQNLHHVRINQAHCIANPKQHAGYSASCWGLTASDDPTGYMAHSPDNDNGTISPTAALASFPYLPQEAMRTARHFLTRYGDKVWNSYGFVDAFCETQDWYADTFLAIDQGPIIIMIENFRTGLLWKLFMSVPEVRDALRGLGFQSPHLQVSGDK